MKQLYLLLLCIPLIVLTGCTSSVQTQEAVEDDWTLFVFNSNKQIENVFWGYSSLSDCWDGAVTATNRGQKYFECGRNCGDFSKNTFSCDFICQQHELDRCEELLG